jgi:hypothetical protein
MFCTLDFFPTRRTRVICIRFLLSPAHKSYMLMHTFASLTTLPDLETCLFLLFHSIFSFRRRGDF